MLRPLATGAAALCLSLSAAAATPPDLGSAGVRAALDCKPAAAARRQIDAGEAVITALKARGVEPKAEDLKTLTRNMRAVGLQAPSPDVRGANAMAATVNRGLVVSAKMLVESAQGARPAPWASHLSQYLRTLTSPIAHGSNDPAHAHDEALDSATAALQTSVASVERARTKLGAHYSIPGVRYLILAHAFNDGPAAEAAHEVLCAQGLPGEVVHAVSAASAEVKLRNQMASQSQRAAPAAPAR